MSDNRVVFDNWESFLSSFGTKSNKANVKFRDNGVWFDDATLDAIWMHDGLSRRVISCIAEDLINKGFTIPGDSANIDMQELDRLNITGNLFEAMCKSQLHGLSAIFMGIDDGQALDKPVAVNDIKGIKFLRVIPAPNITAGKTVITDILSPDYGKPTTYIVSDSISSKPYEVHSDRLWVFPWLEFSTVKSLTQYMGGTRLSKLRGTSAIESMFRQIGQLSLFADSISHLSQEAVIGKYKLAGLAELFSSGEDGEKKVMKRLEIINTAKSVINGVVLDAENGEDYTRDALQFSGMNGVANTEMIFLSGVTGIPLTRLFGRSPAGLDASGSSDLKIYYDMVSAYQKTMLTAFLKKLVFYVDRYKKAIMIEDHASALQTIRNGKTVGSVKKIRPVTDADIVIAFNPLYQMTEKEKAETYFTNAEADIMYLQNGILSKEEIRVSRFVGGYNQYVSVETADIPDTEENKTTEEGNVTTSNTTESNVTKTRKTTVRVR